MTPETIYLSDYTPFGYLIDSVHLSFALAPRGTTVRARIAFRPNPDATDRTFALHGTDLRLIEAQIDGRPVTPTLTETGLTCDVPDAPFVWDSTVEIDPQDNTALEGLYMSGGMYCTQCEAEGFRRITYYPDRPDVMAPFTVRIEGDAPVLLSNGNPTGQGKGWAEWHDPHPKPAYLFALVAGDLRAHSDHFTTSDGRAVDLNLWVRPEDIGKCAFAMQALKLSMDWDERVYGRAYDLDVFNIVAVDDFNGGAMENKGLNLFNSALVLASPDTTTDSSYERIESVIAHEYFHNWTGNRITCRDWFQLCLKEGLTVFRDQQFTSDVRSAAVKRIDDVLGLRTYQFAEDAGPLAHPVRPEAFVEINNFYTATVYEKGAEVIGMLKTLVGDAAYAQALDLYFDRHDGQACTIEDWLRVFSDVTGRDLSQFQLWYSQAGTPRLQVSATHEGDRYRLHLRQTLADTPGQTDKAPMVIPVAVGLLDAAGAEIAPTRILELTEAAQSFDFDLPAGSATPVPSVLRGFSAPVILDLAALPDGRAHLLAHDTDPFNRWEAGRSLAKSALLAMVTEGAAPDSAYLDGLRAVLSDASLDPAYRALMLALPSESDLCQALHDAGQVPDPAQVRDALDQMRGAMATHLGATLDALYTEQRDTGDFDPAAGPAGKRALANAALGLLSRADPALAQAQYDSASNMTDRLAALSALLRAGQAEAALADFETRFGSDRLTMDLWFSAQVEAAAPERAAALADSLTQHPGFDGSNPNRLRAVLGPLITRPSLLWAQEAAGVRLLADWILRTDGANPMLAARLCGQLQSWRIYGPEARAQAETQLRRIADTKGLSRDTTEMVTRLLAR